MTKNSEKQNQTPEEPKELEKGSLAWGKREAKMIEMRWGHEKGRSDWTSITQRDNEEIRGHLYVLTNGKTTKGEPITASDREKASIKADEILNAVDDKENLWDEGIENGYFLRGTPFCARLEREVQQAPSLQAIQLLRNNEQRFKWITDALEEDKNHEMLNREHLFTENELKRLEELKYTEDPKDAIRETKGIILEEERRELKQLEGALELKDDEGRMELIDNALTEDRNNRQLLKKNLFTEKEIERLTELRVMDDSEEALEETKRIILGKERREFKKLKEKLKTLNGNEEKQKLIDGALEEDHMYEIFHRQEHIFTENELERLKELKNVNSKEAMEETKRIILKKEERELKKLERKLAEKENDERREFIEDILKENELDRDIKRGEVFTGEEVKRLMELKENGNPKDAMEQAKKIVLEKENREFKKLEEEMEK